MRRLYGALGSAGFIASIGACTLFTDLSDLESPPSPPAAVDASADAPRADAVSPRDAGPCDDASLCDDFDDGGMGDRWTEVDLSGGQLSFDDEFRSPPRSLRATVDAGTNTPVGRTAQLRKTFPAGKAVRCSFDLRVNSEYGATTRFINLFQVDSSGPGVPKFELQLALEGGPAINLREDITFEDGGCGCPRKDESAVAIPVGTWTRVTFETDFARASVKLGDTIVFSGAYGGFAPSGLTVALGLATATTLAVDVQYDDLRCDLLGP